MKHTLGYLLVVLTVVSCGGSGTNFRVEGRFKNLNQGDFYFFSLEDGRKDTVRVSDGRFAYEIPTHGDTMMLTLLFPNYSEMPIFVEPGGKVMVEGDASHLKETTVKGTKTNDEMTAFRLSVSTLTPPATKAKAAEYIKAHPASLICPYLLQRYFILASEPDYQQASTLCKTMLQAAPDNERLVRLQEQLDVMLRSKDKGRLPHFTARDTKGKSISEKDLTGEVNVIFVWSMWNYDSQHMLRLMSLAKRENGDKMGLVSISLDASKWLGKNLLERDSVAWSNVCTGEMWQTPALAQLGITTLPANIVTDKQGNIMARNLPPNDLKKKVDELLGK